MLYNANDTVETSVFIKANSTIDVCEWYIYVNSVDGKYDIKLNGLNWFTNKFDALTLNAIGDVLMELHFDQFSTHTFTHTHSVCATNPIFSITMFAIWKLIARTSLEEFVF